MKGAPLLVGAVALLSLAAVLCYEQPSPGPLASVHAGLGGSLPTCAACHTEAGLDAGCLGCHTEIAVQLAEGRGFHHDVAGEGAPQCAGCHPEHHGASFDLMEAVAWRTASRDQFGHDHVEFELVEAHAALTCEACHKRSFAMPGYAHSPRRRSFLGLQQTCESCHANVHESEELGDCARCHGQAAFKPALGFDHEEHLPLRGGHAAVACKECHGLDQALSFTAVRGTTCAQCHESPHRTAWGGSCTACHLGEDVSWRSGTERVTAALHAKTGFPLTQPHVELRCVVCHTAEGDYADRYRSPARSAERCDACHGDVHAGQFAGRFEACSACHAQTHFRPSTFSTDRHGVFDLRGAHRGATCRMCHKEVAGLRRYVGTPTTCVSCHEDIHAGQFKQSCRECHDERAFRPSTFGAERHGGFALRGAHREVACRTCHTQVDGLRRYVGTPTSCAGCHEDVHAGQFKQSCSECHDETAFRPARYGIRRHNAFPLRGAHDAVACIACHTLDAAGVRTFIGTPQACASCHQNPHGSQFGADPASVDCADCHKAGSATFAIRPFDHARQTGYALEGKHVQASCNACHRAQKVGAPRSYRGTSTRCDTCHVDQHRGQFSGRDCRSCHSSSQTWTLAGFDHRRTSFPLDGRHARVSCAGCHSPVKQRDGSLIVQYRPLGTNCEDCHDKGR